MIGLIIVLLTPTACLNSVETATQPDNEKNIFAAEVFIDAFYSFDSTELHSALSSAEESIPSIVYYQGWAEGGNYEVVNRMPCKVEGVKRVSCAITVKDDLMGALGIDFDVTDTFHLSLFEEKIISVRTSSNDLQVFRDAEEWVKRERSELIRDPCRGYFDGGPTPGKCVQAMVQGYAEFSASDDFPKLPYMGSSFVPDSFQVPVALEMDRFRLRMLSVDDVEKDYEAVMESRELLHAQFGGPWPRDGFTLQENLADLERHQREFERREAFAYTVVSLDESRVLGCVYIDPSEDEDMDAEVYMWVRQSEFGKGLDPILFEAVKKWLKKTWPFERVKFPGRDTEGI
jgi:RimJ/RimL family protein N-acetyltransferase